MSADFLLELRCEEIPARMQAKASEDLARLFTERLAEAGLKAESLTSYVTPRRLALIAHGLPLHTQAVSEEFKGPRTTAPEQALEGFLRKTGLAKDQLEDRDGVWFAVVEKPGRATADVQRQGGRRHDMKNERRGRIDLQVHGVEGVTLVTWPRDGAP